MKTLKVKNLKISPVALFAALCLILQVAAQTETGRIQGTVSDQAGAVVAGATVSVTDAATNRNVKVQTDQDGNYSILALNPGVYQIEITQASFKTIKQTATLQVQQTAVLNFSLEPGDVGAVVTISNDAPLVESATSALGNVVQGRPIVELPLNGRNVLELARLSPGVTQGIVGGFASGAGGNAETYRGGNTGGAALSVNGQRTQANNFLLDGVDNNESLVNTINIFPSADAIQEFRVQTSVATAEFGRGGGAIINSVVRSGANTLHGSAYTFIRNRVFDAREAFFNPAQNNVKRNAQFRRGQFGGTIGGPVVIPGLGSNTDFIHPLRDKVFFFFSYDGLRQFLPSSTDQASVPTAAFRNGDFSALTTQLRDPATGKNICVTGTTTNNIACVNGNGVAYNRLDLLPAGRLNTAALNYLRAFPLPNNGSQFQQNYVVTRQQIVHQNVYDTRIDANVNAKNQLFGRLSIGRFSQTTTSRLPNLPAGFGSGSNPTNNYAIVTGLNTTITTTVFNEFRAQFNRLRYGYEPPFGNTAVSANLGIVNANRDSSLGGGALIGGYNGQLEYTGDYGPYRVPQNTYQIVDSLSLVKGNQTFKFGGTIVRRNVQLFRPTAGKGYFFLYGNGDPTQCGGSAANPGGTTGFEQADLLIGFVCNYQIGTQLGNVGTLTWENAAFAQDDWKVNSKLTLNLGLRYEYLTNPSEKYGRQANFNVNTGGLVLAKDGKDTLTNTDKNNFSPRIGLAYDLTGKGKSVIRGGYGIFYFLDRGGIDNQLAQNPPYSGSALYSYANGYRITLSGQAPLNSTNNTLATAPLPAPATVNTSAAFLNNPAGFTVLAVLPDNKTSNVQQFNVQFQQQLTNNTALSVGYVGTRGRNLSLYYNLNGNIVTSAAAVACPISGRSLGSCYPGLGAVNVRDDNGKSQYDSLQVQLERRFAKGWQYIASYTFSKTKDNGEGSFDNTAGGLNYIEPYTRSRLDYPNVFSFETVYELPYGRGRQFGSDIPKAVDALIGGWQVNAIFRAQSGNPFDIRYNNALVNLTGDPYTNNKGNSPYLNAGAFKAAASGTVGKFGTQLASFAFNASIESERIEKLSRQ